MMLKNHTYFAQLAMLIAMSTISSPTGATDRISDALTELEFAQLPAGEFIMGTEDIDAVVIDMAEPDESRVRDETPAHKVRFSHAFYMATTEVTQQLWLKIMRTRPGPDEHWQHKRWKQLPVVSVSWHDTQKFIKRLNNKSRQFKYRLPTEAEWEYAARAGSPELRPFALDDMEQYAWYLHSSSDNIQPVAQLKTNRWGLYDMHGNVWEWVADWYHPQSYHNAAVENPSGPASGSKRVRRGGSYHCPPHLIRPAYRAADAPDQAYSVVGFRLVAEPRH